MHLQRTSSVPDILSSYQAARVLSYLRCADPFSILNAQEINRACETFFKSRGMSPGQFGGVRHGQFRPMLTAQ